MSEEKVYVLIRPETVLYEYKYVIIAESEEQAKEKLINNDYIVSFPKGIVNCEVVHNNLIEILYE